MEAVIKLGMSVRTKNIPFRKMIIFCRETLSIYTIKTLVDKVHNHSSMNFVTHFFVINVEQNINDKNDKSQVHNSV